MTQPTRPIPATQSGRRDGSIPYSSRPLHPSSFILHPFVLCLLAVVVFFGCSPEKNYKTLSFFFDGVPNPHAPAGANSQNPDDEFGPRSAVTKVYTHKPFLDQTKCGVCHGTTASAKFDDFTKVESSICLKCHQDVPLKYTVMHGPVASAQCLWCHDPHESTIPHVLRAPAPAVCAQCHQRDFLSPTTPQHADPKADCLACHVAHGGPQHKLLRPDTLATNSPAIPSTQPTTAPAPDTTPGAPQ